MGFIDNPVISALGNQLGLGGVFDAARGATSPSDAGDSNYPTPPVKPGVSKPNIPPYRERPYIPRNEGPMQHVAGGVTPGLNPITPGTMDPATLQSPVVQQMLGQYGVTPPTQAPDPNLFIHNPAAFEKHPVISGLLERGLEGLSYAHPGQNFFQSLMGGVQGMQEANAARGAQVNAQTMAPIQQAMAIQQLQHGSDEHQTALDNMSYHQQLAAHYAASDLTKAQRLAAMPPRFGKDGQPYYYTEDENGKPSWEPDKSWTPDPRTAIVKGMYDNQKTEWITKYGSLDKVPPGEMMKFLTGLETQESMAKGAASIHNTDTRSAASEHNASVRGGGGGAGKLSDEQKARLRDLDKDDANVNGTIRSVAKPGMYADENGNAVVNGGGRGSGAYQAYIGRLNARKQKNAAERAAILNPSGADNTPAPKFSAGNPFVHKQPNQ